MNKVWPLFSFQGQPFNKATSTRRSEKEKVISQSRKLSDTTKEKSLMVKIHSNMAHSEICFNGGSLYHGKNFDA